MLQFALPFFDPGPASSWFAPAPAATEPPPAPAGPAAITGSGHGTPDAMAALFGHLAPSPAVPGSPGLPTAAPVEEKPDHEQMSRLATQIFDAADGGGTNEKEIFAALAGLAPAEAAAIRAIYQDHYGRDLDAELVDELDEDDQVLANALLSGDPVQGAAATLVHAADADDPQAILATLRAIDDPEQRAAVMAEFERRSEGESLWTMVGDELEDEELEKGFALLVGNTAAADAVDLDLAIDENDDEDAIVPILERCQSAEERRRVADAYFARTGDRLDDELVSELDDEDLDLARAVMAGDDVAAAAARLQIAAGGSGTDEAGIFGQLEGKSDDERRALIDAYEASYGSFDAMLDDELGELDRERATQLAAGGTLDPVFAVHYAMAGGGTDEDLLRETLADRGAAEIQEIMRRHDATYGADEGSMSERMDDELSGRDAHYIGQLLDGKPATAEDKLRLAMSDWQFERGTGAGGAGHATDLFSDAGEMLDRQHERLLGLNERLAAAASAEERAALEAEIDKVCGYAGKDVESYHKAQDSVAEAAAMIAGALATLATMGYGGPLIASLAKALAVSKAVAAAGATALLAGGARMATKELLLGDSYGAEEAGADAVSTAIEAATGAAFAGGWTETFMSGLGKLGQKGALEVVETVTGNTLEFLTDEQTLSGVADAGDLLGGIGADLWSAPGQALLGKGVGKLGGKLVDLLPEAALKKINPTVLAALGGAATEVGTDLASAGLEGEGRSTLEVFTGAVGGGVGGASDALAARLEDQVTAAPDTAAAEAAVTQAAAPDRAAPVAPAASVGHDDDDRHDDDEIRLPPELAGGRTNDLDAADARKLAAMHTALKRSETGREALATLETTGTAMTYERGVGSFYDGDRINLNPDRGPADTLAGTFTHEAHHAGTFDRDVDLDAPRDAYIDAALRNEAEAQSRVFEHYRQEGRGGGDDHFGFEEYQAAYAHASDGARALLPDASDEEIGRLARDHATQALVTLIGAARPSTSTTPDAPQSYREHYGRAWDGSPEVAPAIEDLSSDEHHALRRYTSQDYAEINSVLRGQADPEQAAALEGTIELIREGLGKLESYEGEVYRGTTLSPALFERWSEAHGAGEPVFDPAFSSSSRELEVAEDFLRNDRRDDRIPVLMTILSRSGKDVSELSRTPEEAEVLFDAATQFKILRMLEGVGPDGRDRKEIFLRELPPIVTTGPG